MRCIACGAELRLMQSDLDGTTMVPSDEYCAYLCEDCNRSRLVSPEGALPPTEPEPVRSAPAASLRPAESLSVPTTPPTLVPSEDDLDECEVLLRRAIEMVRSSTRWSQPTRGLTDRMPGRSLSSRVVQIHHDPNDATYVASLSRVYAFYGTETARACGRCVTGLDGRWLRRMLQRRRLNACKRCENTQRWFDLKYFIPFGALVMGIGGPYRRFSRAGARRCTISFVGAQRPNSRLISNFTLTA